MNKSASPPPLSRTPPKRERKERMPPQQDNLDPAQFDDLLPQPYRMISKIIELEIIDTAWLEIIRRHPDIELGSDGKQIRLPRNQNLVSSCTPTTINERPFYATSIKAVDDYVMTTSFFSNSFCVVDNKSGRTLTSLPLSAQDQVNSGRMIILSASKCVNPIVANTIMRSVLLSVTVRTEEPSTEAVPATKKGNTAAAVVSDEQVLKIVTTVYVIETLTGAMAQQMPDTSASKHHKKNSHHTSSIKSRILHSLVIDSTTVSSASGPTDPNIFLKLDEITRNVSADISQDGEVLLLSRNGDVQCYCLQTIAATLRLFSKKPDKNTKAANKNKDGAINVIEEDTEMTEFGSNSDINYLGIVLTQPNYVHPINDLLRSDLCVNIEPTPGEEIPLQSLFFFSAQVVQQGYQRQKLNGKDGGVNPGTSIVSKTSGKSSKKAVDEGPPPKSNTLLTANNLSIALASTNLPILSLYGLLYTDGKKREEGTGSDPAAGGLLSVEPMDNGIVTSYLLSSWTFSGLITCTTTDSERSLLIVGLNDGSIFLINLKSLCLLQCIGRHEVAITALTLSQSMTSPDYYIVSGAGDGTMCFFKIITSNGEANAGVENMVPAFSFLGSNGNQNRSAVSSFQTSIAEVRSKQPFGQQWSGCLRAILMDYRHDFTEPVVSLSSFNKYPIVVANSAPVMLSTMLKDLNNEKEGYNPGISVTQPGGGSYLAVYDVEAKQLMGKLSLYEGMNAQNIAWKVTSNYDSKYYTRKRRGGSVEVTAASTETPPQSQAIAAATTTTTDVEDTSSEVVENAASTTTSSFSSTGGDKEMFRRAAKFSATPVEVFDKLKCYSGIVACSSNSFCAVYIRQHTNQDIVEPVISIYHISDIIENLIPGIKTMIALYNENDVSKIGNSGVKALPLFSALSAEERWFGSYTTLNIPTRLKSFFVNATPEVSTTVTKASRAASRSSRGSSPADTKRKMSTTSGPGLMKSNSAQILTEEKLIEYQQQLDPLSMHQDYNSTVIPVGEASGATIRAPRSYILSAIARNQTERNGRKNRLMKKLNLLCEGLE